MKIGFNCREGKFRFWDCDIIEDNDFAKIADIDLKERSIHWYYHGDDITTRNQKDIVAIKELLLDREVHEVELNMHNGRRRRNAVENELKSIDMKINKILKKWS